MQLCIMWGTIKVYQVILFYKEGSKPWGQWAGKIASHAIQPSLQSLIIENPTTGALHTQTKQMQRQRQLFQSPTIENPTTHHWWATSAQKKNKQCTNTKQCTGYQVQLFDLCWLFWALFHLLYLYYKTFTSCQELEFPNKTSPLHGQKGARGFQVPARKSEWDSMIRPARAYTRVFKLPSEPGEGIPRLVSRHQ